MKKYFLLCFFLTLLLSCRTESDANSRAYLAGKVISDRLDYSVFRLQIIQNNVILAETLLDKDGSFKLSGPISNEVYFLRSSEKILSFSASETSCELSPDHFDIKIPAGNSYVVFNEIFLEK